MTSTYGTINYTERFWLIQGEPFVRARLKRVFPRVPQHAAKHICISVTPENTRELAWFIDRYPMDVDRRDIMDRLANQHRDSETRLADLMAGHVTPFEIKLAKPAREYQAFAAQMLELKGGFLLADDLGLGKTVSAICGMVRAENLPVVVVCPAHLPRQWRTMIKEFAPDLTVHILKKGSPYDLMPRSRSKQIELIPPRLEHVNFHDLRHSCASIMLGLGVDLYTISKILGHSNVQTTQRYAHLQIDAQRAALDKLSALVQKK